jgi:hypothetical protein
MDSFLSTTLFQRDLFGLDVRLHGPVTAVDDASTAHSRVGSYAASPPTARCRVGRTVRAAHSDDDLRSDDARLDRFDFDEADRRRSTSAER